jgi:hypothetical protein
MGTGEHAFRLQAIEGGVDGAERNVPVEPRPELVANGDTVSTCSEAHHGEQYGALEFAEPPRAVRLLAHFYYNVEEIGPFVNAGGE